MSRSYTVPINKKETETYNLEEFDILKDLGSRRNICAIINSRRNTGKSVLTSHLCRQIHSQKWYSSVFVFSLTAHLQNVFNFVPKENIFKGLDSEKLQQIWNSQEKMITEEMEKHKNESVEKQEKEKQKLPKILIIMDDIIGDQNIRKSKELTDLFIAGRHVLISTFIITQDFKSLHPKVRKQADIAIAFQLNDETEREAFVCSYMSIRSKKQGMILFDEITKEPFNALVVLNFNITHNPEDYIKVIKADINTKPFPMGDHNFLDQKRVLKLEDLSNEITQAQMSVVQGAKIVKSDYARSRRKRN